MKAVLDRFEGEMAVLLCGDEEVRVDVPKKLLPGEAKEGSWLDIQCNIDAPGEEQQRAKIEGLLSRLKNKKQG